MPLRNFTPFPHALPVALRAPRRSVPSPIAGWSSWHALGRRISESAILDQARSIVKNRLPLTHVVVDDGWASWGDWLAPDRRAFPHGMRTLARAIRSLGLTPGLWIAPFLVHPDAAVAKKHPDWLVRSPWGGLVDGRKLTPLDRFLPYRRFILDYTKSAVRAYLARVMDAIIADWGFSFVKLDFLYAQHFSPSMRCVDEADALLRDFFTSVRSRHPTVHLNASGCPFAPALGFVDSMRINEDTVNPQLRGLWPVNAILHTRRLRELEENLAARSWTRRYWLLDPDAFVCHPSYGLSAGQVGQLRFLIRSAAGLLFLGDNLRELTSEQIARDILPLFTRRTTRRVY